MSQQNLLIRWTALPFKRCSSRVTAACILSWENRGIHRMLSSKSKVCNYLSNKSRITRVWPLSTIRKLLSRITTKNQRLKHHSRQEIGEVELNHLWSSMIASLISIDKTSKLSPICWGTKAIWNKIRPSKNQNWNRIRTSRIKTKLTNKTRKLILKRIKTNKRRLSKMIFRSNLRLKKMLTQIRISAMRSQPPMKTRNRSKFSISKRLP